MPEPLTQRRHDILADLAHGPIMLHGK